MEIRFKEVIDPADGDVSQFASLVKASFADGNLLLSPDRISEFLAEPRSGGRSIHLAVVKEEDRVLGGTLFSCAAATGAGFSEYMVLSPATRGKGVSRKLYGFRREILDRAARQWGFPAARGLLIEVENPWRLPHHFLEVERERAMDAVERWRYFHHMGFLLLDFKYIMPPLDDDQEPVTYLDMFFTPWMDSLALAGAIPAEFLVQTIAPTWRAWAPGRADIVLGRLRQSLEGHPVRFISIEQALEEALRRQVR
jgi:GNAT superfamily N-acetyltransferase